MTVSIDGMDNFKYRFPQKGTSYCYPELLLKFDYTGGYLGVRDGPPKPD